jgi:hypothetical protein
MENAQSPMEKMDNIYFKLQKARVMIQNMNLKKSGKNKFSGFTYYELSDFMPVVNNILDELKLTTTFCLEAGTATLTIINCETPEEKIVVSSPTIQVEMKGCTPIQCLGALHTYMRRYLYMNALEIVENDMLDAQAGNIQATEDGLQIRCEDINSIGELNKALRFLKNNPTKDLNWREKLWDRASVLGADFDKGSSMFVQRQAMI